MCHEKSWGSRPLRDRGLHPLCPASVCHFLGELKRADRKYRRCKANRTGSDNDQQAWRRAAKSFVSKIIVGKIIKTGVEPPLYQIGTARRASRTCRLSGAECVVRPGLETLPISVGRTHQQTLTCRTRIGTPMSFGRAFIPTGAKSKCHSLRKFLSHDFGSELCLLSPSQLPSWRRISKRDAPLTNR